MSLRIPLTAATAASRRRHWSRILAGHATVPAAVVRMVAKPRRGVCGFLRLDVEAVASRRGSGRYLLRLRASRAAFAFARRLRA